MSDCCLCRHICPTGPCAGLMSEQQATMPFCASNRFNHGLETARQSGWNLRWCWRKDPQMIMVLVICVIPGGKTVIHDFSLQSPSVEVNGDCRAFCGPRPPKRTLVDAALSKRQSFRPSDDAFPNRCYNAEGHCVPAEPGKVPIRKDSP
mgnify:CR=1 FL=1